MRRSIRGVKLLLIFLLISISILGKAVNIEIISFNDFHGNVAEDTRKDGKNVGMAKLVGYINSLREKNPNLIVVSAGDNYQGTAISNLTYGMPVTKMMKNLNVVASAVGNHEFDWGADKIEKWGIDGGFDYLAANIYDKETNTPVKWAKPYKIIKIDGIKIAFIGLATEETQYQTKTEYVQDVKFIPAEQAAKSWIEFLKAGKDKDGKPDVIVALTHIPSDQKDGKIIGNELERLTKVEGLDAIITGHSHKIVSGYLNDKPIIQADKYGRALGRLNVVLKDKKLEKIEPSVDLIYKKRLEIIPDEITAKMLEEDEKRLATQLNEKVGEAEGDIIHDRSGKLSELGYWATNVMRDFAKTQIGLTNGGGLRRTLYNGDITMGDMYEIMPFDNQVVVVKVTGKHLKQLINHGIDADFMTDGQFSGLKVIYDKNRNYGDKIIKITLEDGTPIENEKIYTIATNDFIVSGGDRYDFSNAVEIKDLFVPIRDVLVESLKKLKKIKKIDVSAFLMEKGESLKNNNIYLVKRNDNLEKISKKFGVSVQKIQKLNNIQNPNLIFVGQKIEIPAS